MILDIQTIILFKICASKYFDDGYAEKSVPKKQGVSVCLATFVAKP